mgnify:FL=1
MSKRYFVVRNVSAVKDGVLVAAGSITGSPNLETSGAITNGNWGLYKVPAEGVVPTGAAVTELTVEEAQLSTQSEVFNGEPTVSFIQHEQECAQFIRAKFMAAQSTLSIVEADALFTLLEPTSHALSSGSLNLAYTRFNASAVDPFTKDLFNPLFEDFFQKFPRSLA